MQPTDGKVCWKCGEPGHMSHECAAAGAEGTPFLACLQCGKQGHKKVACPENTTGVYIRGGSCHYCGSIHHFAKDCAMKQEKRAGKRENRKQKRHSKERAGADASADVDGEQALRRPRGTRGGKRVQALRTAQRLGAQPPAGPPPSAGKTE